MRIGRFMVEQLSEGLFEIFPNGAFQKIKDERRQSASQLGDTISHLISIDPILVKDDQFTILVDTGIGLGLDNRSRHRGTSNISTNMDIFNLEPKDIDLIFLSHLHYDHAAGLTKINKNMETKPVFGNTPVIIQQDEWDYAIEQCYSGSDQPKMDDFGYNMDELLRLKADGIITPIQQSKMDIIPGITAIKTGGHTPGHQIIRISDAGETAYYLGDLLPDENHLNQYSMFDQDIEPMEARKAKKKWLNRAHSEQAAVLFYHSLHQKWGHITHDENQQFTLSNKTG